MGEPARRISGRTSRGTSPVKPPSSWRRDRAERLPLRHVSGGVGPPEVAMRISEPIRRVPWPVIDPGDPEAPVTREWICTNGLGGYASGTVSGVITRRYHGLLIASLPGPFGRIVMLSGSTQCFWSAL